MSLVYFCTEQGDCRIDDLPDPQIGSLERILNERGAEGWELVSLYPGNDGIVAFWKKAIDISAN